MSLHDLLRDGTRVPELFAVAWLVERVHTRMVQAGRLLIDLHSDQHPGPPTLIPGDPDLAASEAVSRHTGAEHEERGTYQALHSRTDDEVADIVGRQRRHQLPVIVAAVVASSTVATRPPTGR